MKSAGHRLGFLAVTGSAIAWSLGGLFTRLIPVDSWTLLAWRGVFGAAGLGLIMPLLPERGGLSALRAMGWIGVLFVVQAAAGMIFYLTALRHTSVANVAVIYATAPFLAGAIGWWILGERPSASALAASALALSGVVVMVGFGGAGGWLGDALAFGMTLTMAVTMVVVRRHPGIPIIFTAFLASLLSAAFSWPFGAPLAASPRELVLLAAFGVVNFAIGLPLFTFGARRLPPIETALIGALDAPLAPLWVWLAVRETPSRSILVGGVIVFGAVAAHMIATETRLRAAAAGREAP